MTNLNLDLAKTAVLSMDIQQAPVRKSPMFRERNVGQAAKSVLGAARKKGILVIHVAIDYQPAFFSPKNKFLQKIRIPILSAPGVDVGELLEIVDEVGRSPKAIANYIRNHKSEVWGAASSQELTRKAELNKEVVKPKS